MGMNRKPASPATQNISCPPRGFRAGSMDLSLTAFSLQGLQPSFEAVAFGHGSYWFPPRTPCQRRQTNQKWRPFFVSPPKMTACKRKKPSRQTRNAYPRHRTRVHLIIAETVALGALVPVSAQSSAQHAAIPSQSISACRCQAYVLRMNPGN